LPRSTKSLNGSLGQTSIFLLEIAHAKLVGPQGSHPPVGTHEPPGGRQTGRPCAFDGKAVQARKAANESAARAESCGALLFAPLDHPRTLTQFDQVVWVQAHGYVVGPEGDRQIDGAGEQLVVAVAAHHTERQFLTHRLRIRSKAGRLRIPMIAAGASD
jgi:hypothetical protein